MKKKKKKQKQSYWDPMVVSTRRLAEILQEWIMRHDLEHPDYCYGKPRKGEPRNKGGISGLEYIAFHAGRDRRVIQRILYREGTWTALRTAELCLIAIGEEHALQDGRLRVRKNPLVGKAFGRGVKATRGASN